LRRNRRASKYWRGVGRPELDVISAQRQQAAIFSGDFERVAINPVDGRAGVIYTDDTLTTDSSGSPLPRIVLAQQK